MQRLGRILHRRDKASQDEVSPPEKIQPSTQAVVESQSRPTEKRAPRTLRTLPRRDTRSSVHSASNNASPVEPPSPSTAARAAASAAMASSSPRPLDATEQQLFRDFDRMAMTDGVRGASGSAPARKPVTSRRSSTTPVEAGLSRGQASPPRRTSTTNGMFDEPQPSRPSTTRPTQPRNRQHSLTKKASLTDLRSSQPNKPLPKSPSDKFEAEIEADRAVEQETSQSDNHVARKKAHGPGGLDLTNTEDTDYRKHWAPAVTHETIIQNVHEVRQEEITREIHTHDVYHRILPVIDFEVLPARHFVPVEGGYVEISADEVPGGAGDSVQRMLEQALANVSSSAASCIPTRFSARSFEGTEGDYREYTTEDGIRRTEQWWVHPPTVVNEAIDGAEVDYVQSKSVKGGVRATSAASNVVGLSPLLAQQRGINVQRQKVSTATEIPLAGNKHPVTRS